MKPLEAAVGSAASSRGTDSFVESAEWLDESVPTPTRPMATPGTARLALHFFLSSAAILSP